MTPRKGASSKQDKHSDSESEMISSSRKATGARSNMARPYDKGNANVSSRLTAFGGLLLLAFVTRYYGIVEPGHIW